MAEGCGKKCVKHLLFIFNFFITLAGLGQIAAGCLLLNADLLAAKSMLADRISIQELAAVLQTESLSIAVYLMIGSGALTFIVAICGCLGAIRENKYLLAFYFLFLLIIPAQVYAGYLAVIYSNEITSYLNTEGLEFLEMDYGNRMDKTFKLATEGWDVIQDELECCGVTGANDYAKNSNVNGQFPDSCCKEKVKDNMGNMVCGPYQEAYPEGCEQNLEDLIVPGIVLYSTIIAAIAVGAAGLVFNIMFIAGFIALCIRCCSAACMSNGKRR